jgi:hypothetical protein
LLPTVSDEKTGHRRDRTGWVQQIRQPEATHDQRQGNENLRLGVVDGGSRNWTGQPEKSRS